MNDRSSRIHGSNVDASHRTNHHHASTINSALASMEEGRRRRGEMMLRSIRKKKKNEALKIRRNMSDDSNSPQHHKALLNNFEIIPELVKTLMETTSDDTLIKTIMSIREWISIDFYTSASKTLVHHGGLNKLVSILPRADSPRLQFEAGWIVAKICDSGLADSVVGTNDAVHHLMVNLSSTNSQVRETAAQSLGLIAQDRMEFRDALLELNIVSLLLTNIHRRDNENHNTTMVFAMAGLCSGENPPPLSQVQPIIYAVVTILLEKRCSQDSIMYALECLASLASAPSSIHSLFGVGAYQMIQRLVQIVSLENQKHTELALRILRYFCYSKEEFYLRVVITAGIANVAQALLDNKSKRIQCEMCKILTKIAAGTRKQISQVVDKPCLLERLVLMAQGGAYGWPIRKEAIAALGSVVILGNDEQVMTIAKHNAVGVLVEALQVRIDNNVLLLALRAIEMLFSIDYRKKTHYVLMIEQLGGMDAIEDLCTHGDDMIAFKANEILDHFNKSLNDSIEASENAQNVLDVMTDRAEDHSFINKSCSSIYLWPKHDCN